MVDSGSTSDACSISNNLHHDEVTTSYFSREEIEKNSPSRQDGIDLKIETFWRKSYCTFLKELGDRLKFPQRTIATAIVFCHRFFSRQSHAKNDRWTIATACMLLAREVEETPLDSLDFKKMIIFSYERIQKEDLDDDQRKEVYEKQEELVLNGEALVRSTINIDPIVHHPYEPLADAIQKYMDKAVKAQLCKVAESYVNSCLCTSLCLQYKPYHIAGYGFFLAAACLKMNPQLQKYVKALYQEFDVTRSQLEDMNNQMLEQSKNDSNESGTQNPDDNPVRDRSMPEGTGKASESEP